LKMETESSLVIASKRGRSKKYQQQKGNKQNAKVSMPKTHVYSMIIYCHI